MSGQFTAANHDGGFYRYGVQYQPAKFFAAQTPQYGQTNTSGISVITEQPIANSMYESAVGAYISDPLQPLLARISDLEQKLTLTQSELSRACATMAEIELMARKSIKEANRDRDEMYALVEDLKDLNGRQ